MDIKISPNKKRIPVAAILGIIACIGASYLLRRNYETSSDISYLLIFIGLLITAFYYAFFALVDYLSVILDPKTMLLINDKGFIDNLSIFSCGEIQWNEVKGIKISNFLGKNFLVIHVSDPISIINKQKRWKQRTLKGFLRRFDSPILISQSRVSCDLEEIEFIMGKHLSDK